MSVFYIGFLLGVQSRARLGAISRAYPRVCRPGFDRFSSHSLTFHHYRPGDVVLVPRVDGILPVRPVHGLGKLAERDHRQREQGSTAGCARVHHHAGIHRRAIPDNTGVPTGFRIVHFYLSRAVRFHCTYVAERDFRSFDCLRAAYGVVPVDPAGPPGYPGRIHTRPHLWSRRMVDRGIRSAKWF